jgi:putative transposase
VQQARNFAFSFGERFEDVKFLIRDRGSNFTASFDAVFQAVEYQVHYNTARPHQGIAQHVPDGEHDGGLLTVADLDRERIHRRAVLGGLINEYSRAA